jgi:O-antigen/teichoic acid export membrane protein
MRLPLFWRRSATAAGTYVSVVFGFLGTLVAARELGPDVFGLFAIVVAAAGFFQSLLDLTAEEALIKYGYRYSTAEDWGRLRRLFGRALRIKLVGGMGAAAALCLVAPLADSLFGAEGLMAPMLVASLLPLMQSPEGVASAVLIVHGRYDVRAGYLAFAMALRLAGLVVGSRYGLTEAVLGLVVAQLVAAGTLGAAGLVAFRRFPTAAPRPLAEDRRGVVSFVLQSSVATGILSLRGALTPLLLGMVSNPTQVGFFRVGQAPQAGFTALTSPVRLILLTEQTRDWERGAAQTVFAGVRRYSLVAACLMAVAVPPIYVFMPELVRFFYGDRYGGAATAARLMLLAGALLVVTGWAKSLPVSIGRPGLRILTHGIETAVVIPLVLVLGGIWDAAGAAAALLIATAVFCAVWLVLLVKLGREPLPGARADEIEPTPSEAMLT